MDTFRTEINLIENFRREQFESYQLCGTRLCQRQRLVGRRGRHGVPRRAGAPAIQWVLGLWWWKGCDRVVVGDRAVAGDRDATGLSRMTELWQISRLRYLQSIMCDYVTFPYTSIGPSKGKKKKRHPGQRRDSSSVTARCVLLFTVSLSWYCALRANTGDNLGGCNGT